MESSVRNVSRLTVEVTFPLTDESMADPFNTAVETVEQSGLYPDICWEDNPAVDQLDHQNQTYTVTLSETV